MTVLSGPSSEPRELSPFVNPPDIEVYRRELTDALDSYVRPVTYEESFDTLMGIPGMEKYEGVVDDVLEQIDAEGMVDLIAQSAAWSTSETTEYLSNPERLPYQSFLQLSPHVGERMTQLLTIGNFLRFEYDRATPQDKQKAAELLRKTDV